MYVCVCVCERDAGDAETCSFVSVCRTEVKFHIVDQQGTPVYASEVVDDLRVRLTQGYSKR